MAYIHHSVCTSTNKYRQVHTCMYLSVLVCNSTYQYRQVQTSIDKYIPVCTGLYWYVLVHTRNSWIQKRCKQGSNPWSYAYFSYTSPLHCKCKVKEFRVSIKGNVGVYIKLVLFMSVYLALDDKLTAADPHHRPHRPWRPQRGPGLEPHDGPTQHRDCDRLWPVNIVNMSEIYKYIAVHTSTYQYIPVHTNI